MQQMPSDVYLHFPACWDEMPVLRWTALPQRVMKYAPVITVAGARRNNMKFESIKGNMQRFNDLIDACGGTQGMIDKGIPWEKVAWGSTYDSNFVYVYFEIKQQIDEKGELHLFAKKGDELLERTKRDLAYSCDLYDKDGKLLNIMFWGF